MRRFAIVGSFCICTLVGLSAQTSARKHYVSSDICGFAFDYPADWVPSAVGSPAQPEARRLLAGKGDGPRLASAELRVEDSDVGRSDDDIAVHTAARLAQVGEADADARKLGEVARCKARRDELDLPQRRPEPVSRAGIVDAAHRRSAAGGGADEHDVEIVD